MKDNSLLKEIQLRAGRKIQESIEDVVLKEVFPEIFDNDKDSQGTQYRRQDTDR